MSPIRDGRGSSCIEHLSGGIAYGQCASIAYCILTSASLMWPHLGEPGSLNSGPLHVVEWLCDAQIEMREKMPRGKASGITLTNKDASVVLGMVLRDDREHDIAAWFGVNQGRIAEVKDGSHGVSAAPIQDLPPKGPPGPKGRQLRWN